MKSQIIKRNNKCYVEIPQEYMGLDEVELFTLRDNYMLISPVLGQAPKAAAPEQKMPAQEITPQEAEVLGKLMKIRFAERTPGEIDKRLSPENALALKSLVKKGMVNIFYGDKYTKTGVYSISKGAYALAGGAVQQKGAPLAPNAGQQQAVRTVPQAPQKALYAELVKTGWMIIPNIREAEQFTLDLKAAGVAHNVKGMRGFDGKYYIATTQFLASSYEKMRAELEKKGEMHISEFARGLGMELDAARVVLTIATESGEIFEKRRDVFCMA
jgi:hypothetical protein